MKLISAFAAVLFSVSVLAAQSDPFYLVLQSSNSTLDGKALGACHEGAGIEGLCVSTTLAKAKPSYQTFQLNYTRDQPNSGLLTWELIGGDFEDSEPMQLSPEVSTNVAIALFEPDDNGIYVSFDSKNLMYIKSYYDDTVNPPVDGKLRKLYHWYACEYNYSGYLYDVLCWVYGTAPPQNPSCQKVGVERVFKKSNSKRNHVCAEEGSEFLSLC